MTQIAAYIIRVYTNSSYASCNGVLIDTSALHNELITVPSSCKQEKCMYSLANA